MKQFRIFIITLLLALVSFGAIAQPQPAPAPSTIPATTPAPAPAADNDMFKDWQTMNSYLVSKGVYPMSVNWTDIDSLCNGIKMHVGERAYNKCAYEKALDFWFFSKDKEQCETQAKGQYPDSIVNGFTSTVTETGKDGVPHTSQRTIKTLSPQSLTQVRDASVIVCMQQRGWADAANWSSGKSSCAH